MKSIGATDLRGIFPAIPTPVTFDDKVDPVAVGALVDYLTAGGVSGLVPLGGTGEYGSLSREQRARMVALCVERAGGRIPVVAGVLDPGLHDASAAVKAFAAAGADALMVVTPYYTNPTQGGIFDYFTRIADSSAKPIILYEIPYRTRVAIEPEVIHRLSEHDNIIGMKACNTDLYHFLKVVAGVSNSFAVLSGEDTLFPLHLAAGAVGGIIVTSTLLPKTWVSMYRAGVSGQHADALAIHRALMPLLDSCFAETNPGPMKSVWDLIGVEAPDVMTPLQPSSPELQEALRIQLRDLLEWERSMSVISRKAS